MKRYKRKFKEKKMKTIYRNGVLKFENGAELDKWQIEAIVQNATAEGLSVEEYLSKNRGRDGWEYDQIEAFTDFLEHSKMR